jgi:predicted peptidase
MKKRYSTSIAGIKWIKGIGVLLSLLINLHCAHAQDFNAYKKAFFIRGKDTLRYRILYPENDQSEKSYPLVVFLHGAGFRGKDNERQLGDDAGSLFLQDSVRKKFPALVVFPQCPADSMWNNFPPGPPYDTTVAFNHTMNTLALCTPELLVKLLLDSLAENKIADKKRIYLGGNSLGAFGAYDLVIHYPDYFAAAFIMCGQANVDLYPKRAAALPIWIFHGGSDDVIDPWPDRSLFKALKQSGAKNARHRISRSKASHPTKRFC